MKTAAKEPEIKNPKMLVRTRDGIKVYWSRIGWSPIFGMKLDEREAEFRRKDMLHIHEDIAVVPWSKVVK